METTPLDARGLSCPEPVVLTQRALAEGRCPLIVLVDDNTPRENIRRYAEHHGYTVTEREDGDTVAIEIRRAP